MLFRLSVLIHFSRFYTKTNTTTRLTIINICWNYIFITRVCMTKHVFSNWFYELQNICLLYQLKIPICLGKMNWSKKKFTFQKTDETEHVIAIPVDQNLTIFKENKYRTDILIDLFKAFWFSGPYVTFYETRNPWSSKAITIAIREQRHFWPVLSELDYIPVGYNKYMTWINYLITMIKAC